MTALGPVQFIAAGFGPETGFEGRILADLERFEQSGALRVLDVLFVRRALTGKLDTLPGTPDRPTVVSQDDVDEGAAVLEPGHAAGLVLIEHVWARELQEAVNASGGAMLQQGMLAPEHARALLA